jgi:uncharacterized protein with HEPN domain
MESDMIQESVIRCYEVIGEIVKRLDPNLLAPYPHIPWKSISGFRDLLIHNYDEIRLDIVWEAVEDDLPAPKHAVEALLSSPPESDSDEPTT